MILEMSINSTNENVIHDSPFSFLVFFFYLKIQRNNNNWNDSSSKHCTHFILIVVVVVLFCFWPSSSILHFEKKETQKKKIVWWHCCDKQKFSTSLSIRSHSVFMHIQIARIWSKEIFKMQKHNLCFLWVHFAL